MALLRAFPALTQDVQCCKENINDQDRFWSEALWAVSQPMSARSSGVLRAICNMSQRKR